MSLEKLKSIGLMGQNKALDTLIPLVDYYLSFVLPILYVIHMKQD
jgi:hypothetical protein